MLVEGAIVIPKLETRIDLGLPAKYKKFRLTDIIDLRAGRLESLDGAFQITGTMNLRSGFYNPAHVNMEIMNLLESGSEIKSFNAVTVDGKIIQIESTEI